MARINHRLAMQALPLTLACALVTSCALGKSPVQAPQGTVSLENKAGADLAARASALGLAAPDSYVQTNQLQIKDTNGSPLSGVQVIVGDQKVFSDDRGVVTLPDEVLADNSHPTIATTITKDGYVGQSANVIPGAAVKLTKVDPLRTAIGAAGGTARNSDGTLEIQFPPGALTGDAQVAVTRTYSDDKFQSDANLPQGNLWTDHYASGHDLNVQTKYLPPIGEYKYNMDLGGAQLAPGSKVMVRFKVEGPMLKILQDRLASGDDLHTLTDTVSKDAQGNLWLTMQSLGPAAAPDGPQGKYSLKSTTCQTFYDETEADVQANGRAMTACIEFWAPSYRDPWLAAGNHIGVGGIMTHDGNFNGGGCMYFDYDPNLYVCRDGGYQGGWWADRRDKIMRRWYTSTINAHVSWASDDSRIAGQAIPGALVNFSHTETPVHPSVFSQYADGQGDAHTTGLQNSGGSAIASVPSMSYTYGRRAYYNVDCSVAQLQVVKNKPRAVLQTSGRSDNHFGAREGSSLPWPTNLGTITAGLVDPTVAPTIDLNSATASFNVNGNIQPSAGLWVDIESGTHTIGWNQSTVVPVKDFWSRQISARLTYASNDNTVPADMRPSAANQWAGKAATGSTIQFNHEVSTASNKPANRDQLVFNNTDFASTWGLNGQAGTVTGTHASPALTLTGSANYNVSAQEVPVRLNANLPEVDFTIVGAQANWKMDYDLTDAAGQVRHLSMMLPAPSSDGKIHVWLPVEEAVGSANNYTFRPTFIGTNDFAVQTLNGDFNFPALTGQHRSMVTAYTGLKTMFVTPK